MQMPRIGIFPMSPEMSSTAPATAAGSPGPLESSTPAKPPSNNSTVVIPGGTHYTPVEYPKVVTREFLEFLSKIPGYAPQEVSAS